MRSRGLLRLLWEDEDFRCAVGGTVGVDELSRRLFVVEGETVDVDLYC
ncbi:MAG: hypothetical protein NZ733_01110 [Aigarchaeota archaeon]|nr:hypothetical protein [Aigarchaeota archaeon]MCS7127588.1 hypothetical protein [Candidatus Calditenuaceae archaeon]MCX8203566.1 hypothetical protein [Nitrososphaeria archaeon]MDW8043508.1 hypothetical protein [Nitrososphaerota archaeon]